MFRVTVACSAGNRGISVVEALVAIAIVLGTLGGTTPLVIWSQGESRKAGALSIAVLLASEKLHQLRGLTWHVGRAGESVADLATDLAADPPAGGGSGLAPTSAGTLANNRAGYADYLDAQGLWIGSGTSPPSGTRFVRRWAIEAHPSDPFHSVVLHVLVLPAADAGVAGAPDGPHAVHVSSILTRVQP